MGDLNLIPYEIRIQEQNKKKKIRYIILSATLAVIITIITCIPFYFIDIINKENEIVLSEIEKLSYITNELNKVNEQKKLVQTRLDSLEAVAKLERKWTAVINEIASLLPTDITVTAMNTSSDLVSMQCISVTQQSIAVFLANLENSQKYDQIKINEIMPDQTMMNFKFTLSFKIKSDEGKVK